MDFGKAFTFAFDDPEWVRKVLINALIGLIPIVGQIYLLGWGLETARRVAMRSGEPLPDVDFGTHLGHGFRAFVVSIVWTAPIWVIALVLGIISAVATEIDPDIGNTIGAVLGICVGLVGLIFGLFLGVVLPAALTRSAVFGSIKGGLDVGTVWALVRSAPGAWLMVLLGNILAGILAGIAGTLLCGIGVFVATALYQVIMGHLYGRAYLQSSAV